MWLLKLEGSSGNLSSKLLQAGSIVKSHQAAQNFCQSRLENLRRWRLHSLTADCLHDENFSSFLSSDPLLCWFMPSLTFFHVSVVKSWAPSSSQSPPYHQRAATKHLQNLLFLGLNLAHPSTFLHRAADLASSTLVALCCTCCSLISSFLCWESPRLNKSLWSLQ